MTQRGVTTENAGSLLHRTRMSRGGQKTSLPHYLEVKPGGQGKVARCPYSKNQSVPTSKNPFLGRLHIRGQAFAEPELTQAGFAGGLHVPGALQIRARSRKAPLATSWQSVIQATRQKPYV